jgi:hypothetical protein
MALWAGNASAWATALPVSFWIDESRSSVTWEVSFLGGNVPVLPLVPGSTSTPVDGAFSGIYQPNVDTLSFSQHSNPGPVFQPDVQPYPPAESLGILSSVAGTFSITDILTGIASASQVSFGVDYLSDDFRFFDLSIGSARDAAPAPLGISLNALITVQTTGFITAQSQFTVNSLPETKLETVRYTRLDQYSGEWALLNLNRKVDNFTGITIGGAFLPGELRIRGNIIANFTTVPEANSSVLLAVAGLGLLILTFRRVAAR